MKQVGHAALISKLNEIYLGMLTDLVGNEEINMHEAYCAYRSRSGLIWNESVSRVFPLLPTVELPVIGEGLRVHFITRIIQGHQFPKIACKRDLTDAERIVSSLALRVAQTAKICDILGAEPITFKQLSQ